MVRGHGGGADVALGEGGAARGAGEEGAGAPDPRRRRAAAMGALAQARNGVELADETGDVFQRMARRTTLATALHAMDLRNEAAAQYEEAERMQKEWQPAHPVLYSIYGFRYCDLLLDQGRDADVRERAVQTLG